MASHLSFLEEGALAEQRAVVLNAIRTGTLLAFRAAWSRYQELAEAGDQAQTFEYQIGLILAKADIWNEAGDQVRYWENLLDATMYAESSHFELPRNELRRVGSILAQALGPKPYLPEYFQAIGNFEVAIDLYLKREQTELADYERGMVKLRLAECYRALHLTLNSPNLTDLLEGSIQSALLYLEGYPEQVWALRLLDEFEEGEQ